MLGILERPVCWQLHSSSEVTGCLKCEAYSVLLSLPGLASEIARLRQELRRPVWRRCPCGCHKTSSPLAPAWHSEDRGRCNCLAGFLPNAAEAAP